MMIRGKVTRAVAAVAVLAGIGFVLMLSTAVKRLDAVDQAKGLLGSAKSCDDLNLSELKREYPKKSRGLGLAFMPYADGLEKCGTLTGKDREMVRSIFGPSFDFDRRVDSWRVGSNFGFIGPAQDRSMAVHYSPDGLVTRVKVSR